MTSGPHAGAGELRAWLDGHVNLERGVGWTAQEARIAAPTLERIRELVGLLGSPQLDWDAVHLTGTNGKTSTARILTTLLVEAGCKTGNYTSPDLERINERMSVDGEPVADAVLDELLAVVRLAETAMQAPPSYFEIMTAAALRWFSDEAVDVGVIEVGMGGRWDATNVVDGVVAVVTNVDLDHTNVLGHTRHEIAVEKSGIIKPVSTLVLGETDPDLVAVFEARPHQRTLRRDRDFAVRDDRVAVGGRLIDITTPRARYDDVFLSLHGAHQAHNAVLAVVAAEAYLDETIPDDTVRAALGRVTSPGRLEVVRREPLVLLDGAHNPAGAQALRSALAEAFGHQRRTLVVGLLQEKDPLEMLAALGLDECAHLVVCAPPSPRALAPERVAAAAEELGFDPTRIEVAADVREAVGIALLETPQDAQVVITGSLYVVGAARSILVRGG